MQRLRMAKIVARMKGGLGNQLFCYAAARRLAVVSGAELVIDDHTGFIRDHQYQRRYALDRFAIPCRKADAAERLEPVERLRRGALKFLSRRRAFADRRYIEQEGLAFDPRLLALRPTGTVYLDGLWQGEGYFKDIEAIIRQDLRIEPPGDPANLQMSDRIRRQEISVAVHVRWFTGPGAGEADNAAIEYYGDGLALMQARMPRAHYFVFSDNPEAARTKLPLPADRFTLVSHNPGDEAAHADMWLMSQCQHFVIANSTFSWWSAWLAANPEKLVVAPRAMPPGGIMEWGFAGQLPDAWIKL